MQLSDVPINKTMLKQIPYYLLKWSSSAKHLIVRRFTWTGMLLLFCLITSALLGVDTYRTTAYEIFTFLAALFLASLASLLRPSPKLSLSRSLPEMCTVGEEFSYRIIVKNEERKSRYNLLVSEVFPDPRPNAEGLNEEFKRGSTRGKMKRLFSQRGYFGAWRRQINRRLMARTGGEINMDLSPSEKRELSIKLIPLRRGFIRFKAFTVARPDPLGIIKKLHHIPSEESLLVLPRRYPLPPLTLSGRRMHHQGGVSLASSVGNADEFISLRDYRPGDPLRTIHWKSWAKTGKPVVREYEDEHFSRHALLLDTFSDEGKSELFEEALSVAASFASSLEKGESLLDLMFVGSEAFCFTSGRNMGTTEKMLEILACVELCRHKEFSELTKVTLSRASLLSSAIAIFLSWDEARQTFVQKLQAFGIPLLIFVLAEEGEDIDRGVMKSDPQSFHLLERGKIAEALAGL